MSKAAMRIPLTPGQAVTVHGWLRPKDTLSWTDVLANPQLTMSYLHSSVNIPKELLHRMQPDIMAWVRAGRVSVEDGPSFLSIWAAHPIRDLKADLADIAAFKWSAKTMRAAGRVVLGPERRGNDARDHGGLPVHALRVEHAGVYQGGRRGPASARALLALLPHQARRAAVPAAQGRMRGGYKDCRWILMSTISFFLAEEMAHPNTRFQS